MNVLGISAFFHDAAAALYRDGEIVAAIAEDRLTHIKHDANFPLFAIDFCLKQAALGPEELDAVVFYEEPHVKFSRVLTLLLASFPKSLRHFVKAMPAWLTTRLWLKTVIAHRLGVDPDIVFFVPHHISHACQAFFPSGFDEAAILTVDGVGEWATASIGRGCRVDETGVELLETNEYPHSLGLAYGAITGFLGFTPNDQECSTMALAAFGEPRHLDHFRNVLRLNEGKLRIERGTFEFLHDRNSVVGSSFAQALGLPPRNGKAYNLDVFSAAERSEALDDVAYADVAASLQARTDEILLGLAVRAHEKTGLDRLCLAGGVAYNAVSVGELIQKGPFREVYVPPDPGDAGGSVGAALYWAHSRTAGGLRGSIMPKPYLGTSSSFDDLGSFLNALNTEELPPPPVVPEKAFRVEADWRRVPVSSELLITVVEELQAGRVVGWLQGRSEFGPRALGNRSILADPSRVDLARKISRHVKVRQSLRPYALSVAEEDARTLFELPNAIPHPARWMQMVIPVRPEVQCKVRGAIHIDGTTRPQICCVEDNPLFHALLMAYGERSGLAALLNTSLNLSGLPLCAGAPEALALFWSCDVDTLVINDWIIRKR